MYLARHGAGARRIAILPAYPPTPSLLLPTVAATCMFLACKLEEAPRTIDHVIQASLAVRCARVGCGTQPKFSQGAAHAWLKADILNTERKILLVTRFSVYDLIRPPQRLILFTVKAIGGSTQLAQCAWAVCNDLARTAAPIMFAESTILAGAIFRASALCTEPLSIQPLWWQSLTTSWPDVLAVAKIHSTLCQLPIPAWMPPVPSQCTPSVCAAGTSAECARLLTELAEELPMLSQSEAAAEAIDLNARPV